MPTKSWFPTQIYFDVLQKNAPKLKQLNRQILKEVYDIADLDLAGQSWSKENYRNGYTSYASVNNLHQSSTTFSLLEAAIDEHVKKFSRDLDFDLKSKKIKMNTCWVNIMAPNTHHGMHLHPQSVLSGTYYVSTPEHSSAIKFEDPRLSKTMNAPAKKLNCSDKNKQFVSYAPKPGTLILFESWLRHEVPLHVGKKDRVSISFNYDWA